MQYRWSDIQHFIRYDLWRHTSADLTTNGKRLAYSVLRTIALVVRGFTSKNLNDRANSLTYSLIFTIVPLLAMVLAVAKGFGVEGVIEDQLNRSFLAGTGIIPTIMEMVERYLETAQGGVFIGVGILILLWAIYSFFRNVELAFDGVWNIQKGRSLLRQLTTYVAILFLIPVLMIITSGLSIFIQSATSELQQIPFLAFFHNGLARLVQFVLVWALFTWMYIAIPNTKVNFWAGLIPGVLVGSIFQGLQMLSVYLIMFLGRTSIVYGAFASVPILLILLQWTCLLLLIGAQLSFAIQNNEQYAYEQDLEMMSRRYKDFITLWLLRTIIQRFEQDLPPMTAAELATTNGLPLRLVNQLLTRLSVTGLLREIYIEGKADRTFQPALDSHKISVGMVIERIDQQGSELFLVKPSQEMQAFWKQYLQLRKEHATLNEIYLDEL